MSPETPSSNPDIEFILAQLDIVNTTITSQEAREHSDSMKSINPMVQQTVDSESDTLITEGLKIRLSEASADEIRAIRVFLEALEKANMAQDTKRSIRGDLKMELATDTERAIIKILGNSHEQISKSMAKVGDDVLGTIAGTNTLH